MRLASAALLSLATGLFATSAYADWAYAKWGMSQAEVLSASKGAANPVTAVPGNSVGGMQRIAVADTVEKGIAYEAQFYFNTGFGAERLNGVRLVVKNTAQCDAAIAAIKKQFGPGTSAPSGELTWTDAKTGNNVSLGDYRRFNTGCHVLYQRRGW